MAYQAVKDQLYKGHRKIANNTYLTQSTWQDNECVLMHLHGNLVALFYPDYLQLYTAGWDTVTTKDRLNMALKLAGVNQHSKSFRRVYQVGGIWYYGNYHRGDSEFVSGMWINYEGKVIS